MRKIWDIHGGIHPAEQKHLSNQSPVQSAGIPEQLIFPLQQHIGAPADPIVEVGQRVLKGEMIAEAKGFVSVPVHASTSGEIVAIESRPIPHPSGLSGTCIILKPDGQDEWIEHSGVSDATQLDQSELLTRIRNAGIAGMGGAGFPSAVKLATREDHRIDSLIINGTECEPYITADDMLMRERADEIVAGVKILQQLIEPREETLIGVEDNKPEAITALQQATRDTNIEVVVFPTKYPSGGEKQLIQILTGKEVPSGGLPAQVGVVVQNVGTAAAISRAIHHGEPLIQRITTVTGESCGAARNYEVLLGTPVEYLLTLSQFDQKACSRLILGGPMMGYTIESDQIPVVKTTNCVLAPSHREAPPQPPAQACIRCGLCAEACPATLLPQQMYWFARGQELEKLEEHNIADCIECGACSFACPSQIPLVQYFRAGKAAIREAEQDRIKAEHSKLRFEARQARLEREEAEKEAKRKARQEAAKARTVQAAAGNAPASDPKADIIAAAIARTQAKKSEQSKPTAAPTDPAQAAIERAKAKRSGDFQESLEEQRARLEKTVASTEKRLTAAREKLQQAEAEQSEQVEVFRTAVEKTEAKLQAAKSELAALPSSEPAAPAPSSDPAQAAIQRAQAARDAAANMSEEEKAAKALESLKQRLAKAEQRLAAARESGDENVAAFETSVEKLQAKLAEMEPNAAPEPQSTASLDPAQAAIERAQAARDAAANMSDEEKAAQALESLKQRLAKAEQRLATARENNDENVSAFEASVEKLQAKLAEMEPAAVEPEPQPEVAIDPAQAAIERAKAAREAAANQSPEERLQQSIASLEKRIANTQQKLAEAEESGADNAEILAASLEKMTAKLDQARADLANLN